MIGSDFDIDGQDSGKFQVLVDLLKIVKWPSIAHDIKPASTSLLNNWK